MTETGKALINMALQPFCSTDYLRAEMHYPWSLNGDTYATDGRILICTYADIEEPNKRAPDVSLVGDFNEEPNHAWMMLAEWSIPRPMLELCESCEGEGWNCEDCDFEGSIQKLSSVQFHDGPDARLFALHYIWLLKSLPGCWLHVDQMDGPNPFIWSGGRGYLQGLRDPYPDHSTLKKITF